MPSYRYRICSAASGVLARDCDTAGYATPHSAASGGLDSQSRKSHSSAGQNSTALLCLMFVQRSDASSRAGARTTELLHWHLSQPFLTIISSKANKIISAIYTVLLCILWCCRYASKLKNGCRQTRLETVKMLRSVTARAGGG